MPLRNNCKRMQFFFKKTYFWSHSDMPFLSQKGLFTVFCGYKSHCHKYKCGCAGQQYHTWKCTQYKIRYSFKIFLFIASISKHNRTDHSCEPNVYTHTTVFTHTCVYIHLCKILLQTVYQKVKMFFTMLHFQKFTRLFMNPMTRPCLKQVLRAVVRTYGDIQSGARVNTLRI